MTDDLELAYCYLSHVICELENINSPLLTNKDTVKFLKSFRISVKEVREMIELLNVKLNIITNTIKEALD